MPKFTATISKGHLRINDRPLFLDVVSTLKDGDYVMTIEEKKKKRSNSQNAYYYGVVVEMVFRRLVELGHDVNREESHEFLKASFNYKEIVNEGTGEIFKIPRSTTTLDTFEFSEYVDRIIRFGSEVLDIQIPLPNEQTQMF